MKKLKIVATILLLFFVLQFPSQAQYTVSLEQFTRLANNDTSGQVKFNTRKTFYALKSDEFGEITLNMSSPIALRTPDAGVTSMLNKFLDDEFATEFNKMITAIKNYIRTPNNTIEYNVVYNQKGFVSLLKINNQMAEEGISFFTSYLIDNNSIRKYKLSDLIDTAQFKEIEKSIYTSIKNAAYIEDAPYPKGFASNYTEFAVNDKANFVVTDTDMKFLVCNHGEAGEVGGVFAIIPLSELKNHLALESPLARLFTKKK